MRLEGKLEKSGSWWAASVPAIGVFTQGKSKGEAYAMVADAIQALDDDAKVRVTVTGEGDAFYVACNGLDFSAWLSFVLRRMREESGKSLEDVRVAIGASSRNAYARYESGESIPSAEKLEEIVAAIADMDLVLRPAAKAVRLKGV